MKAMTWLKVAGCVLVALAALAAADTRRMEVTGKAPWEGNSRVIASDLARCPASKAEQAHPKSGCCEKEESKPSGCCRK